MDCTCIHDVKGQLVAELRGQGQPSCEAHPPPDQERMVIPLNDDGGLKALIFEHLDPDKENT